MRTWGCEMRLPALFGAVSIAALAAATGAFAQDAGGATAAEGPVAEIVVTGSRIQRRDFTSPSPIVTAGAEQLQATGTNNIEQVLNQLPQFAPGQGAANGTVVGGGGRATLNLRGLGEQRNLVLLDGRRLPASNALGVVDVNVIPTAILQSVEVISGGASAVYGSDAISGVANFKTIQRFTGLRFESQYGNSFRGDARTFNTSITGGGNFADDKGNAVISFSYSDRQELVGAQREFYRRAVGGTSSTTVGVASMLAGNNPSQAAVNSIFGRYGVGANVVAATSGFGFNDDGTLFAANGGANLKPVSSEFGIVNGVFAQTVAPHNTIVVPQKRYTFFGKLNYDITPDLRFYGQAIYAHTEQRMAQGYPISVPSRLLVPVTNPFIPADLRALLASRANPNAPFLVNRRFQETGKRYYDEPFDVFQVLAGFSGKLPMGNWTWDVYGSHDETTNAETLLNGVSSTRVQQLLTAPDGGASICAGGYNVFGFANAMANSAACIDYISVEAHNTTKVSQDIVEATAQGTLFALPAGDVKLAVTAGRRENRYSYIPDGFYVATPATPNGDLYSITPTSKTSGSTGVTEAAAELLVPLLQGKSFADSVNLSLGYRYSDYDLTGGVSTYKAEVDWRVIPSLLLRGGYEHAIRAPNIAELFTAPTGALAALGFPPAAGDPCDFRFTPRATPAGASIRALCITQGVPASVIDSFTFGNGQVIATQKGTLTLKPETADTFTAGFVWRPPFKAPLLSQMSLSIDYYDINLKRAISPLPGATAVNKCFNLDGSNPSYSNTDVYCQLITRDSNTGAITDISTPYLNLGGYKTSGIDIQFEWRAPLDAVGLGEGQISLQSVVNYLDSYKIQTLPGTPSAEYAGTIGVPPLPKWKALSTLTYRRGPAELGLRWVHVGAMDDVTVVTRPGSPSPGVKAYNTFDLIGRWDLNETVQLRAGVTNIADKKPLVVGGVLGTTNGALYDVVGRAYYMALRLAF